MFVPSVIIAIVMFSIVFSAFTSLLGGRVLFRKGEDEAPLTASGILSSSIALAFLAKSISEADIISAQLGLMLVGSAAVFGLLGILLGKRWPKHG